MWSIRQASSYFLVQHKDIPPFWLLETFPLFSEHICECDFIMYIFTDGVTPLLLPYQQKKYNQDGIMGQGYGLPWPKLLDIFKQCAQHWEMCSRLRIFFTPQIISLPHRYAGKPLYYSLSSYPYGYLISVEHSPKFQRPDEFSMKPDCVSWTRYLVFHHHIHHHQAFLPYQAQGRSWSEKDNTWKTVFQEDGQSFLTRMIGQLAQDQWFCKGKLEISSHGILATPAIQDWIEFLFTNASPENPNF